MYLIVIVWNNGIYQITGGQGTPAAKAGTDLIGIAPASGIILAHWATDEVEFDALIDRALATDGPHVIGARIDHELGKTQTDHDPIRFRESFMRGMQQNWAN